jgi:hypothetical protein
MAPVTVDAAAGAVIETVGGVVSAATLLTVTLIAVVPTLPLLSVALAVMVWEPFVKAVLSTEVAQLVVPVAVTIGPPSTCT